jgi:hypothetical protein
VVVGASPVEDAASGGKGAVLKLNSPGKSEGGAHPLRRKRKDGHSRGMVRALRYTHYLLVGTDRK